MGKMTVLIAGVVILTLVILVHTSTAQVHDAGGTSNTSQGTNNDPMTQKLLAALEMLRGGQASQMQGQGQTQRQGQSQIQGQGQVQDTSSVLLSLVTQLIQSDNGHNTYNSGPNNYNNGPNDYSNGPNNYNDRPYNYDNGPNYSNGPSNYNTGPNYSNGPSNYNTGPNNYNNGPSNYNRNNRRRNVQGGSRAGYHDFFPFEFKLRRRCTRKMVQENCKCMPECMTGFEERRKCPSSSIHLMMADAIVQCCPSWMSEYNCW